jgi:hypothetical protein
MLNQDGCGKNTSWPILSYFSTIFLEELGKITRNLSQNSRSFGRDLKTEQSYKTNSAIHCITAVLPSCYLLLL